MSQTDPPMSSGPIPVQPLPYSAPEMARRGRPPLVTAIAVLCIVVACLSGMFNFVQGMYAFGFYMMAKVSSSFSAVAAAGSTTAPPPVQNLQPGEVGVADNVLESRLALDAARVRELDKLLRAHGRAVFGTDEDTPLTAAMVRESVKSSKPAGSSADSPATFATDQGTVQIYRDHAVFTPDQEGAIVRTSAANNTDSESETQTVTVVNATASAAPATRPADTTLTPAQVDKVMAAVKRLAPAPLKTSQLNRIKAQIAAPNQQLVTPGVATPVSNVDVQTGGSVVVTFDSGIVTIGPKGQLVSAMSTRAFAASAASGFGITGRIAGWVMLEAGASLLLAIYLLIVGILAFRTAGRRGILLKTYAVLKILLAVGAGVALPWMAYEFAAGVTRNMSPSPPIPSLRPFVEWGIGIAVLGMALPIGLLIALRAPSVRDFYSGQTIK